MMNKKRYRDAQKKIQRERMRQKVILIDRKEKEIDKQRYKETESERYIDRQIEIDQTEIKGARKRDRKR